MWPWRCRPMYVHYTRCPTHDALAKPPEIGRSQRIQSCPIKSSSRIQIQPSSQHPPSENKFELEQPRAPQFKGTLAEQPECLLAPYEEEEEGPPSISTAVPHFLVYVTITINPPILGPLCWTAQACSCEKSMLMMTKCYCGCRVSSHQPPFAAP